MNITTWWRRHFTAAGRDAAWRERYERCHGEAYPGHVPQRPMPAPATAPPSTDWPHVNVAPPRVLRPGWLWTPAPSSARPVGPMSIAERAERFRRGMEVVHSLSPECLRMLQEDGRILSEVASRSTAVPPPPPRPRHHGMFIVADETITAGQAVHLNSCADGSYAARVRRFDRA